MRPCFAPLLAWVLSLWPPGEHRLVVDATTLGQRFTVLVVCVLYGHTALPIAWVVLPATQPGTWKKHWLGLLRGLAGYIPSDWIVLVLADRDLGGALGWGLCGAVAHPDRLGPRASRRSLVCVARLDRRLFQKSETWGVAMAGHPHGGSRASQSLVASVGALATLWTVTLGSAAEAVASVSNLSALPPRHLARQHTPGRSRPRKLSLVLRGRLMLLAELLQQALWSGESLPPRLGRAEPAEGVPLPPTGARNLVL